MLFRSFFSALTKNTIASVILTYIFIGFFISGSFSIVFTGIGLIESLNASLYYSTSYMIRTQHFLPSEWLLYSLYLNPIVTIFDVVSNAIGVSIDSEAIKGVSTIVALVYDGKSNLFFKYWSVISMVLQLAVYYLILGWSSLFINKVKPRKSRKYGAK